MELNYFDLVVGVIILLLGLKGILNGFLKEVFGLVGIVGGIFIASRFGGDVGGVLSDAIFKFESHAAVAFTGFLFTLALFWLLMIAAGILFKRLSTLSGLGPYDRILGFVFGSSKFFLIASVIVYAVFNVNAIKRNLEPAMANSMLYEAMYATGGFVMKIDAEALAEDVNETTDGAVDAAKEAVDAAADSAKKAAQSAVAEEAKQVIDDVKANVKEAAQ
jgi:membrane protein required for colicin V production